MEKLVYLCAVVCFCHVFSLINQSITKTDYD